MPDATAPCPCGSQQTFENCCQPLLAGMAFADTAEALMRSRYSAFSTGNIDYLIDCQLHLIGGFSSLSRSSQTKDQQE